MNNKTGWVVGESGTIYRTKDAGVTWSDKTFTDLTLNHVSSNSRNEIIACGQNGTIGIFNENCQAIAPSNYSISESLNICIGTSTVLTALGQGKISWYSAPTGGQFLRSSNTFQTPVLSNNTTYYVQDSTCSASPRLAIQITVNTPVISKVFPDTICGAGSGILSATSNVGTIKWFNTPTGGTAIASGSNFTTPVNTNSRNYYVQTEMNLNCISSRAAVNLTVLPALNKSINKDSIKLIANESNASYQWYDCSNNAPINNATSVDYRPIKSGFYKVLITKNNCSDTSNCIEFVVKNVGIQSAENSQAISIYPNPSSGTLHILSDNQIHQLIIYDLTGKIVYKHDSIDLTEIILELSIKPGIYFLETVQNNTTTYTKIIISNQN
ncbi:MAG: T9SS type A sorting domain-containing protein [Bacteroidia bacterium]|nr:T9SS type A sorting domain-containing protein [Bacteroidia bacterium]